MFSCYVWTIFVLHVFSKLGLVLCPDHSLEACWTKDDDATLFIQPCLLESIFYPSILFEGFLPLYDLSNVFIYHMYAMNGKEAWLWISSRSNRRVMSRS